MKIKRQKIDTLIEQKIVLGLITNTEYISKVSKIIKTNLFSSEYLQIISDICLDYYNQYSTAPEKQIKVLFEESNLDIEMKENISLFLCKLSDYFVENHDVDFMVDFMVDKTQDFFKKKIYSVFIEKINNIKSVTETSNISQIDSLINELKQKSPSLFTFSEPLKNINNFIKQDQDIVISGEEGGKLGRFLGDMKKGWLVSFQAPEKGGKSFFLNEMVFLGLEQRKKVLFISLEMGQAEVEERIYNRLTGAFKHPNNPVVYSVLDCEYNQTGECKKICRECNMNLVYNGEKMKYPLPYRFNKYKPCTFCRGHETEYIDFKAASWFKEIKVNDLTNSLIKRKIKVFNKMFRGNQLIVKSFPAMSATIEDIKEYISSLENNLNFHPDMVVLDYIDICDNSINGLSSRDKIDYNWKQAKQMAQQKHFLVISGEQSRKLLGKEVQDVDDVSEDKRKNAHIDAKFSINQTREENDDCVRRLGQLLHRHRKITSKMLFCTGFLEIAQPALDCEEIYYKQKTKKTNNF